MLPLKCRHAKSKPKFFELYMVKYKLSNSANENNRTEKPRQIFIQNGMKMGKTKSDKNWAKLRWERVGRTVNTHTLFYSIIWIRRESSLCRINRLVTDICIKIVDVHWIQRGASSHVQRNLHKDANTLTSFPFNYQPDAIIMQIYCHKTLRVSGIFFAHHQEFCTVHSALVSCMQVFDDRFPAESGWKFE